MTLIRFRNEFKEWLASVTAHPDFSAEHLRVQQNPRRGCAARRGGPLPECVRHLFARGADPGWFAARLDPVKRCDTNRRMK